MKNPYLSQTQKRTIFVLAIAIAIIYSITPVREIIEPLFGIQIYSTWFTVGLIIALIALWGVWRAWNVKEW